MLSWPFAQKQQGGHHAPELVDMATRRIVATRAAKTTGAFNSPPFAAQTSAARGSGRDLGGFNWRTQ
jgi:hypothetical protein